MEDKVWEVINKSKKDIVEILLENRGIKTKGQQKEFFSPTHPKDINVSDLGIVKAALTKSINRINKARERQEKIIIFGDYDADGICSSAILWECLYGLKFDVLPYIPSRFSEGYGLKPAAVEELKAKYPSLGLIITVDNGIVAHKGVNMANKLGIDVIIVDHHQIGEKLPKAFAIVHSTMVCGSALSWLVANALSEESARSLLELAAIGTIADQMPLNGVNRSFVKYGLEALRKTKRVGLLALFKEAAVITENIGTYEVGFLIAPRLNAMGRLGHAIDSLRLICTKQLIKAQELAHLLGKTNVERQKVVEEIVIHSKNAALQSVTKGVLVLTHSSYHEGIIGLAASKLVEQYGRPAIVISEGEVYSKASARSIVGINIIEIMRQLGDFLVEVGGHEMAAGFTIETNNLIEFQRRLEEISSPLITPEVLAKKIKIDTQVEFPSLTWELAQKISEFAPFGIGNPAPLFMTKRVEIMETKKVGNGSKHLKLKTRQSEKVFDSIAFGLGEFESQIRDNLVDLAYNLEENEWNGTRSLQLKIKDIKLWKKNSKS